MEQNKKGAECPNPAATGCNSMANPCPVVYITANTKKQQLVSAETAQSVAMQLAQEMKAVLLQQVPSRDESLVFSKAASAPV